MIDIGNDGDQCCCHRCYSGCGGLLVVGVVQ